MCSSLIDAGALQVYLIGMAEEQDAAGKASKYDSYALDKMSIRVSSKVFGARIRCAHLHTSSALQQLRASGTDKRIIRQLGMFPTSFIRGSLECIEHTFTP